MLLWTLFFAILTGCTAPRTGSQAPPEASPFRVMSFNIRLNTPSDSLNAWPHRREAVASLLRFHDPDLIGLQEAQRNQLEDLERFLPGYRWFGLPRADGGASDEHSAILYRASRFEPLETGTFWLSESPDERGSRGWDAAFPRIATWGIFRDIATGDTLLFVNTHFDHVGERARAESARLLRRWLTDHAGALPIILAGDFNALPDDAPVTILTDAITPPRLYDALTISAEPPYGPDATWNGFRQIEPGRRIDFVFVGDGVRVLEHATLSDTIDGVRYPSDHLPVLVEMRIEG